ncbi:unnamed protein product [Vicia faba]|uniref:DUF4283 domain-containing protein n=1 Tax=Vicia faba TaxID=3906 RepID=A0AAV0ZAB2_VICFA|nr:unnamed protein product [Vicia faba]
MVILDLISEGRSWWSHWREEGVDKERVTWLRVYGILCHVWNFNFFEMLANKVGKYVCCDENTLNSANMDITRILVRTTCCLVLNESFNVLIDDIVFRIKMLDDSHGPLRISLNRKVGKTVSKGSSSDFDIGWHNQEDDYV